MNFFNTRHKCTRSDEEYQRPSGGIFLPSPLTWCSACDARPLFQVGFCQKAAQNKQAGDSRISILNGHPLFSELAWNRLLFSELAWNISEFSKAFLVSSSSFHFGVMLEFSNPNESEEYEDTHTKSPIATTSRCPGEHERRKEIHSQTRSSWQHLTVQPALQVFF
jgi:hypothetical protein